MDIWPVLTQGAKSPHTAILLSATVCGKAAVRAGDWKLLHNHDYELYNLASDIGETKNLAASNPAKLAEMKDLLQQLLTHAVPSGEVGSHGKAETGIGD